MRVERNGTPTFEPVSLTELKAHLRLDSSSQDALLTSYISAAREVVEDFLNRSISRCGWVAYYTAGEVKAEQVMEIPRPPLFSASSVALSYKSGEGVGLPTYQDITDQGISLTIFVRGHQVSLWKIDTTQPSLSPDVDWGDDDLEPTWKLDFEGGYANAASVPEVYNVAIMNVAANFFDPQQFPESAKDVCNKLLRPEIVHYI